MKFRVRVGEGFDVHQISEGLTLTLGGVVIPHNKGCVAHSDGDVVIHAICDALLGAVAMGDIGLHFPDTAAEFSAIDSKILLRRVCEMVAKRGYEVCNVDCTIRAQQPKLRGYIDSMRSALAETMNIDVDQVSVKATTTEKMGFEGREEGISTSAIVLVQTSQA